MAGVVHGDATVLCSRSNPEMINMALPVVFAATIGLVGSVALHDVDVPVDARIRLQRTSCLGTCPVYTVTVAADGTVNFDGERHVRVVGRQTARIGRSVVARLLASAERIHFFDLRDAYRVIEHPDGTVSGPSDLSTTIVTITVNGRTKRVEDYFGTPDDLAPFEREIDEAAGTKRWIFLDEETLEALRTSGWSASAEEGAKLLREAIERDEVTIARILIEMGADLYGPRENPMPPLLGARSGPMVELLVRAGADVNERPVDRVANMTPLLAAHYKDVDVTEALLKAGARVEDSESGRTALWYAACNGNWRVVAVLLRAGANSRGGINVPAVECTRRSREDALNRPRSLIERGQPTVQDFDQVIAILENAGKARP